MEFKYHMKSNLISLISKISLGLIVAGLLFCHTDFVSYASVRLRGYCGDNLSFTVTDEGGGVLTLTISGTGDMYDYNAVSDAGTKSPWSDDTTTKVKAKDIATIIIEEGVTSIGENAFSGKSGVYPSPITLPSTLKKINKNAFTGASIYGNLIIPEGVTYIGDEAFSGCARINGVISLPSTLNSLGVSAFKGMPKMTGTIRISNNIKKIPDYAFSGCAMITEVDLGKNVETIGNFAFDACGATTLTLPAGLKSIGKSAFNKSKLEGTLIVPASVTDIKDSAFKGSLLSTVRFLGNAPNEDENAFETKLVTVNYNSDAIGFTTPKWHGYNSAIYEGPDPAEGGDPEGGGDNSDTQQGSGSSGQAGTEQGGQNNNTGDGGGQATGGQSAGGTDADGSGGSQGGGSDATSGDGTVPGTTPSDNTQGGQSDTPGNTQQNPGQDGGSGNAQQNPAQGGENSNEQQNPTQSQGSGNANAQQNPTQGEGTGNAGDGQGAGNQSGIPGTGTGTGGGTGAGTGSGTDAGTGTGAGSGTGTGTGTNTAANENSGTQTHAGQNAQNDKDKYKYTIVFDSNNASSGSMDEIVLNAGEEGTLPKNKYHKTGYVFTKWKYSIGGNTYYAGDGSVVKISEALLKVNGLEAVKFTAQWSKVQTAKIEKIGTAITDNKSASKYVVSSSKNKTVKYVKPVSKKITSVSIPDTVTSKGITYKVTLVDAKAFKNCRSLRRAKIGKNVDKIGNEAFYGCIAMTSMELGSGVTTIGYRAFYDCDSLKSLTLPASTYKLGKQFVSECDKLKTIYVKSSKLSAKTVSDGAFSGVRKKVTIKVVKAKVPSYKTIFRKRGLSKNVNVQAYRLLR